mgnify:CR=1 FL=1
MGLGCVSVLRCQLVVSEAGPCGVGGGGDGHQQHALAPLHRVPSAARPPARAGWARWRRGLVIHDPPGTGKFQTIIIGDPLARDQRVCFVCDKRTTLDVVYRPIGADHCHGLYYHDVATKNTQ